MTSPPYILEHLEEMAKILKHPQVFSYLHIPVQSGSDRVLEDMKREYTCSDFEHIVNYLTEHVPGMTIATDIIAAFPTETEAMFAETMALVQRHQFAIMNYTQFYPRPGTPAAKMKRVMTTKEARRRTKAISEVFNAWDPYASMVGSRVRVWITEEMARDKVQMIGHTKNYTQVLIACDKSLFGSSVEVDITKHIRFAVFGVIVPGTEKRNQIQPVVLGLGSSITQTDTNGNRVGDVDDQQADATKEARSEGSSCCGGADENGVCCAQKEVRETPGGSSEGLVWEEGGCCDGAVERDVNDGQCVTDTLATMPASTDVSLSERRGLVYWLQSDQALVAALVLVVALFLRCAAELVAAE